MLAEAARRLARCACRTPGAEPALVLWTRHEPAGSNVIDPPAFHASAHMAASFLAVLTFLVVIRA